MSRSYKKQPWYTDHKRKTTKQNKAIANRQFRRRIKFSDADGELPVSRSLSRKVTNQWDICDYKDRMTRQEAIEWYLEIGTLLNHRVFRDLETWLKYWEKCHVRK